MPESTFDVAAVTSSFVRTPCIFLKSSSKYPLVNPLLENTFLSEIRSGVLPSRAVRQAFTAPATYSGRFILPSILNDVTPSFCSSGNLSISDKSFSDSALCLSPLVKSRRHGCAQRPLLPLLPPRTLLI